MRAARRLAWQLGAQWSTSSSIAKPVSQVRLTLSDGEAADVEGEGGVVHDLLAVAGGFMRDADAEDSRSVHESEGASAIVNTQVKPANSGMIL